MTDQTRLARFEAVRDAIVALGSGTFVVTVSTNDIPEPVLEVQAEMLVWTFGMNDEPIWGYELAHDDHENRSWAHVKEASMDLPEMSERFLVAATILGVVERDLAEYTSAEAL